MWEEPVKYSEGWNFGPNDEDILTVEEIVKDVIKIWGDGDYTVNPDNKFHEARLLKLDISKAHSYLKWKPVYNARKALLETINWYKIYLSKSENIYDYTVKQLSEYVEKAQEKELIWTK